MAGKLVKLVVFAPKSHAKSIRQALGKAGAGKMGRYAFASFSSHGVGRFLPLRGAKPALGKIGQLTLVAEERIETLCRKKDLAKVLAAVKKAHPYQEPAIDVYPLLEQPKV